MIEDDELTAAGACLHDRFGVVAADRFASMLPDIVGELTCRWQLRVENLLDTGATSAVLAVSGPDGDPLALKLSPDHTFLARQELMLQHLRPTGRVPAVVAAAPGALLLERIDPGTPLDADEATDEATAPDVSSWADLVNDLHTTPTDGVPDQLEDRCEDMIERISTRQQRPAVRALVPDGTWARAVDRCRRLLEDGRDRAVVHGDLHPGNVLASDSRGLVAIDPKMCVGDRCYDVMDAVTAGGDPETMVVRAHQLAHLTGIDADRVLAWSGVDAVITAISRLTWFGPERRSEELLTFAAQL